jgi:hypothetical protein
MKKVNQFLTVAFFFLLVGYFAHRVAGLIVPLSVIVGMFWAVSFIITSADEEEEKK